VDDSIPGDKAIAEVIEGYKKTVTEVVFASRGFAIDLPLARVSQDIANTFSDIPASTLLANLCTDAFRRATGADVTLTANGMMRAGLTRGNSGVQTVYDVFAVAPLGAGVKDTTAGSTLVTGFFTGIELKNMLEFFLVDNPAHPGEYFPRTSGLRFTYDPSRPKFDVVTAIELGDLDRGYTAIDMSSNDPALYSLSCPMYLALILVAIPNYTKGKLALVAKGADGQPLQSKVEAVLDLRGGTPDLLPPKGTIDATVAPPSASGDALVEIKEWQAIMDYLRALPVAASGGLPVIPTDERANEIRAIRAS
jgi:5'-nucleotidase